MMHRCILILSISLLAGAALLHAADPLDAIFARIDATAKTFKGMTADISNTEHHAIVPDDDDVSTGIIRLLRVRPGLTRLYANLSGAAGTQNYAVDGAEVRVYNPKTKILDIYDLSSRQGTINQFLLLGFGASSTDLKSTYNITYVGEEKVGEQVTTHLKLVPKSAETLHTLKQADLWFSPQTGLVARQKLFFGAGDYKLVTYSNMKPGALQEKDLELKPKDATITKH
jgi:outer membrane lipoprotein-sorting protein